MYFNDLIHLLYRCRAAISFKQTENVEESSWAHTCTNNMEYIFINMSNEKKSYITRRGCINTYVQHICIFSIFMQNSHIMHITYII